MITKKCPIGELKSVLEREMHVLEKRSVYAQKNALNDVAFAAKRMLSAEFRKKFHAVNKTFPDTVRVTKASNDNAEAKVFFPWDWFYLNTEGGTKHPEKARTIAVLIDRKNNIDANGKVKRNLTPARLLAYHTKHPVKYKNGVALPHAFILKGKSGKQFIVRALSSKEKDEKGRIKVEWLYVLMPEAYVNDKWPFDKLVQKMVDETLEKAFWDNFEKTKDWK